MLTELDGTPVDQFVGEWSPYYAASNEPTRLRDIGRFITRGVCGNTTVKVKRKSENVVLKTQRIKPAGNGTAAADGNVSRIPLPGGLSGMISGIGVFYPDKRPTQRVGIIPDREVKPTVVGIRAGKDEVLEEALRWILSSD